MTFPVFITQHKIITGTVIVALVALAIFIFYDNREIPENYTFVAVSKGSLESTISSSGTLNPVTEITVGTQVSGTIEKVFVDFNDKVRRGQIIAVLDSALLRMSVTVAEADLLKASALLEEAQFNFARSSDLAAKDLMSESDFQTVKTALKTAQAGAMNAGAALQRARKNLNYSIIRSPITGTVTSRNIEAGQTVAASFATPTLFTIAEDLSKMEITAAVDESDIGQIRIGQSVRFAVQAYPALTFVGIVKQVHLKPTTASNVVNYTVVVSAANPDALLMPGMTTTVSFIIVHKTDVLLVANAALRFQPTDNARAEALQRVPMSGITPRDTSAKDTPVEPTVPGAPAAEWKNLWYLDSTGNLATHMVQVGITDGTNTEILGDHFPVGAQVINGSEADGTTTTSSTSSGGMRPPVM